MSKYVSGSGQAHCEGDESKKRALEGQMRGVIPRKIHLPYIKMDDPLAVERKILDDPQRYLMDFSSPPFQRIFGGWNPQTIALSFDLIHVTTADGNNQTVLGVTECTPPKSGIGPTKPLRSWVYVDEDDQLMSFKFSKIATLPPQFMDDDSYEQLARYTYTCRESGRIPASAGIQVNSIGHEWVDYPLMTPREQL